MTGAWAQGYYYEVWPTQIEPEDEYVQSRTSIHYEPRLTITSKFQAFIEPKNLYRYLRSQITSSKRMVLLGRPIQLIHTRLQGKLIDVMRQVDHPTGVRDEAMRLEGHLVDNDMINLPCGLDIRCSPGGIL